MPHTIRTAARPLPPAAPLLSNNPSTATHSKKNKNLALEGLRGLACLAVFNAHFLYLFFPYLSRGRTPDHHLFVPIWPWETWFANAPFTLLYNGDFAVSIFLALSGYVLMRQYWQSENGALLTASALKRYPRLVFPAAASIAFAFVLVRLGWMHSTDVPDPTFAGWARDIYTNLPPFRTVVHAALSGIAFRGDPETLAWNGPLWTLPLEFWGSVTLFALFALLPRRKTLAAAAFAGWALLGPSAVYYIPFLLGALLNRITHWLQRHSRASTALFSAGILFGLYDYTSAFNWITAITPSGYDKRAFWFAWGAVLTVAGVIGSKPIAAFFSSKIAIYLGRISFSLYLLHWPIIFSFSIWIVARYQAIGWSYLYSGWLSYLTTAALLIILAELFCRFVDLPSIKLANIFSRWALRTRTSDLDYPLPNQALR